MGIIGDTVESSIENGNTIQTYRIRAYSKSDAKRRASAKARVKGLEQTEVIDVKLEKKRSAGRQSTYLTKTISKR